MHDVLAAIVAATNELKVRWYLSGTQAVVIWGRPRLTADLDVTAVVSDVTRFVQVMDRHGFALRVLPVFEQELAGAR